ncbi:MAG: YbaK/EbsC family protein [Bacilli bacterium]|nr:YbaK/EbsC family protein [Bacilli bacterium]
MSFTRAKEYIGKFGLAGNIMEFNESSATVDEAAHAIGCDGDEIGKTLSFLIGEDPILILVSGNARIDNSKYKQEFKTKAKMIKFDDVERLIGHAVGGVCPFGVNDNVKIYLDESLKKHEIIYPAAGSSNSAVKLTISELEEITNYEKWIDVCKEGE